MLNKVKLVKYILLFIFIISSFLIYAQSKVAINGNLNFTENKNQWEKQILYKADIPHGSLFLENNCFTFNFINPADIEHSHKNGGKEGLHKKDTIHYFAYKVHFLNSNPSPKISGNNATADYCNYFIGNDKSKWASHVKNYKKIIYKDIYNNIDLEVYSKGNDLKYDFIVNKGGNANDISIYYEGLKNIELNNGDLKLITSFNIITEISPLAFEGRIRTDAQRGKKVDCRFVLNNNIVKFEVGKYDNTKILTIDPQLIFSTYSGSVADNWGFTATFDKENNVYSGGIAFGTGYPVTVGAYQEVYRGDTNYRWGEDIGIIKYDSLGKQRLYATYLGGNSAELPYSLIVNESNELLIFGTTGSDNFPVSENAYSKVFKGGTPLTYDDVIEFKNGTDIFVTKLSADGSQLLASTYLGGSDNDGFNFRQPYAEVIMEGNDSLYFNYADGARGEIITDNQNNVYVGSCTFSKDFPVTTTSFQPNNNGKQEGIVFKLDNFLSDLLWSSYIGGGNDDAIYSIDVDNNYNLYVAGGTNSLNFPTGEKAFHKNYQGGSADGFISYISKDGTTMLGSSYFGSDNYDQAYFVRVDKQNFPYITGQTKASGKTLIYNAKYNKPNSGQFIAKFSTQLDTIKWSTVFGTGNGRPNISITAFAVDVCDKIYLSGWGREWPFSAAFPNWSSIEGTKNMDITGDAIQKQTDGMDFYIMVLEQNASTLFYGTYFGELNNPSCSLSGRDHVDGGTSRFDKRGNIYESVCASCSSYSCQNFPTTPGVWSNNNKAFNCNNAVFKINVFSGLAVADFNMHIVDIKKCYTPKVQFENTSDGKYFLWKFGDGQTSKEKNPLHIYEKAGIYDVTLISLDSASCNTIDSIVKQLILPNKLTLNITNKTSFKCNDKCSGSATAKANGGIPPYSFAWSDGQKNPTALTLCPGNYNLTISDNVGCTLDTIVVIEPVINLSINIDTIINSCFGKCKGMATVIAQGGKPPYSYLWDDGQTDTTAINLCPKTHSVTVTESSSNSCSIDFNISEYSKISSTILELNNIMCYGECKALLQTVVNGGTPPYSYLWDHKKGYDTLQNVCAGQHMLTVVDKNNCLLDTNFTIESPSELKVNILTTNVPCSLICDASAMAKVSGGTASYNYLWSNGKNGISINELCMGSYILSVTDANSCLVIKEFSIKDSSIFKNTIIKAEPDTIYNGESSFIKITPSIIEYSYSWAPSANLSNAAISNPVASPNKTTTYYVTITSDIGCTHVDSVTIYVLMTKCSEPYIFIPNAFTPSANQNNILYVRSNIIESMYLAVYNRWGEKIFETTDIKKGWDGTYKGKNADSGVFDYYIEATCFDKEKYKHKGNITLIR